MVPSPYFLSLVAVILAGLYGGSGPAALATTLSLTLANTFFLEPTAASTATAHHVGTSALFLAVSALMTFVCARVRTSLHQARQARAAALAQGNTLATTLRCIADAVLTTDSRGLVRFINPVASYLTGWREAEALGQPLERVLHLVDPSSRQPLRPTPPEGLEGRPVQLGQLALLRSRHGGELPIEHSAAPLLDVEGRRLGAVFVFRDISARLREDRERGQLLAREAEAHQEAVAQRQRLETLFMQAPVAICLTRGPEHVVEFLNPLAQTLGGGRLTLGTPAREAVPGLDPSVFQLLDDVYRSATPITGYEVPLRADYDGSGSLQVRYFDLTWQPWRGADGHIQGTMGLCADVTEQVLARSEVETLAAHLESALQVRDDFLSVASHELKTPLTSLLLQLQLLARSLPETDAQGNPHPARLRVEATRRPALRLQQLVNTLLDVSRIRAGRLAFEYERVDFAALLTEVVARSEADAASAGCTLHLQAEHPVIGRWDRLWLEQVVTNLLANALKYGAQQPVHLSVVQEGSHARLTVKDNGIGIAPEHQARIFQRFERAVSQRHYGGFGLGLWIAREIIESFGGDIRVESQPGQGATFTVTLPLKPPASAQP
jgi:PAS domain S-box-containing protein